MRLYSGIVAVSLLFSSISHSFSWKSRIGLAGLAGVGSFLTWARIPKQVPPTPDVLNTCTMYPPVAKKPNHTTPLRTILASLPTESFPEATNIPLRDPQSDGQPVKKVLGYAPAYNGVHVTGEPHVTMVVRGCSWEFPSLIKSFLPAPGRPRNGGGLIAAYGWMRHKCLHTPTISFDFVDYLKTLNFGQSLDQAYIDSIRQQIIKQNSQASITLMSDCIGSARILNYVVLHNPKNVDTLVLLSPFISLDILIKQKSKPALKPFVKALSRYFLPNYKKSEDIVFENVKHIKGKRIFIAQRRNESCTPNVQVDKLVELLREHNTVYYHMTNDTTDTHSHLASVKDVQAALNAFYAAHSMPHDPELAREGKELLELARIS